MKRYTPLVSLVAVLALVLMACQVDEEPAAPDDEVTDVDDVDDTEPDDDAVADGESLRIAFFASSSQNDYNQAVYEGVQDAAAEAGNVETEIFDGEFNAEVQYNQIEDMIAAGRFDGFVVVPNDTVGIEPVIQEAFDAGIPVASALFPIGPDLTTLEPQVDDIITAATPVQPQSVELAEGVAEYCQDLDPCRVIILIGQLQFPFDNVRYEAMTSVLDQHDNIELLATGEGSYDRDLSLTVMQDLLQTHPDFDVLLSNADQHVAGALIALEEAGLNPEELYIAGGGTTETAINGIRDGLWDASATNFPYSEGLLATQNLIRKLRGEDYENVIDMTEAGPISESVFTAATLEQYPDFTPEWDG
jgi:ribose transport system substrate-binding protein